MPTHWGSGSAVGLAGLVVLTVVLPLSAQTADKKPLTWGADAEGGEPFVFKDAAAPDRDIGFEVDLVQALSRELGREIRREQLDFDTLTLNLERKNIDLALNGLEITPDREENVRFSRPYYVLKLQLVTRADDLRVSSLADCKRLGLKVGALINTAATRLLEAQDIPHVANQSQVLAFQQLETGAVDAVLADVPVAVTLVKDNPRLRLVEPPIAWKGYYGIAFRKEDKALAEEFDRALQSLRERGELYRIYKKWNIWNDSQDELMTPNKLYDELGEAGPQAQPPPRRNWTFRGYFPLLVEGARLTVLITVASMALAVLVGLVVAVLRLYGPGPLRLLAVAYVEFFRGVPVMLLLFLIYYGLPSVGQGLGLGTLLQFQPLTAAVLGLGLNYAAYEAEVYRAGIASVGHGQWEAAASLGMSPALTFRRIILPQALRVILPPSTGDFVALFKDTSIVSGITLVELSKQYQILSTSGASYAQIAEIGAVTATLYLAMSLPLGHLSRWLEARWGHEAA